MSEMPLFMMEDYWPATAVGEFLHPCWGEIAATIDDTREGADHHSAWIAARDRWLAHNLQAFNHHAAKNAPGNRKEYHLAHSEHFSVLAPYKPDVVAETASLGEKFRTLARRTLGEEITTDPPMGYVILIPHGLELAQSYLRAFDINATALLGVFLGGAGPHIVMHDRTYFELRLTFIHELNHAVLHKLTVPHWVHEGLSRYFESKILSIANMYYASDRDLSRNRFWREAGLADYWNGSVFYDGRATAGYVLANRMVTRLIKGEREKFTRFMLTAQQEDSGDSACREVYGVGILEMMRDLVGPGEWEGPNSREVTKDRPA